jgi:uncharacterized Zn-finger protein
MILPPGVSMAAATVPHLCNDLGVDRIRVGVKELQCMGARPPFDHPHVYLDTGVEDEIICPYCSTLYVHDQTLGAETTEPNGCIYTRPAKAA